MDDACILDAFDFPGCLTQAKTAAYSRAKAGSAAALTRAIQQGDFSIVAPIPAATLSKIIDGARRSEELSASNKKLLPM